MCLYRRHYSALIAHELLAFSIPRTVASIGIVVTGPGTFPNGNARTRRVQLLLSQIIDVLLSSWNSCWTISGLANLFVLSATLSY
jgi:hypothetical protein